MLIIKSEKKISAITFPQSLYDCQKIATANHTTLGSFSIYVGLSKKYADDIKKYSLDKSDTALQEGTGDYKRFGESDYEDRYSKKPRTQIILVHDETDEIASFVWFGPRNMPEDIKPLENQEDVSVSGDFVKQSDTWFTSSYRTYGIYRGVKITSTFSTYVLELYSKLHPLTKMWLAVQVHNKPAIGLYKRLGFRIIGVDEAEGEYVMILES